MGNHFGKCALCGKESELTFEHIPPRKAFNWIPEKTFTDNSVMETITDDQRSPWDFSGLKYRNDQRGTGGYTLCESCNSLTGTWYGDYYVEFAKGFHGIIQTAKPKPRDALEVQATFYPLPVIKQIASMFCSVNIGINSEDIQLLREFVLNKESTDFPKDKFKIGMYLFAGGMRRQCPITVLCKKTGTHYRNEAVSEIATYPIGLVMYFSPDKELKMPFLDITSFCDYSYNEEKTFKMTVPVYECNIVFPCDFRSKAEIEQCTEESRKWKEDHCEELSKLYGPVEKINGEDV